MQEERKTEILLRKLLVSRWVLLAERGLGVEQGQEGASQEAA